MGRFFGDLGDEKEFCIMVRGEFLIEKVKRLRRMGEEGEGEKKEKCLGKIPP